MKALKKYAVNLFQGGSGGNSSIFIAADQWFREYLDGTSDRTHYGAIAQDVEDLIVSMGMTTQDFGGIVKEYPYQEMQDSDGMYYRERDETSEPDYYLRYECMPWYVIARSCKSGSVHWKRKQKICKRRLSAMNNELKKKTKKEMTNYEMLQIISEAKSLEQKRLPTLRNYVEVYAGVREAESKLRRLKKSLPGSKRTSESQRTICR